ncbi:DUF4197 domain-containing protein [Ferruginibacter albus]|uniref:DUF4197 domain-containing protein n=1 Tax=Ferruginibacter albus TaxID=2875540 RepID=UPI001CC69358|nr:DUF4197 domain-containing protein [Ferruginibacter albus]UAY51017.1 DUF4197 domain-containing protein [Ferruginibacter albus]
MKKIISIVLVSVIANSNVHAQGIGGLLNQVQKAIPSTNKAKPGLSNDDIISGLKEALKVGADSSVAKVSKVDGFFKDAAIKILLPPEAQKVESTLRSMGMGSMVDKAILSMNRAAEDAAGGVGDIFLNSITHMTITDGLQILQGNDTAATSYLRKSTTSQLTQKFRPVIDSSLKKFDATKYWNEVFTTYNKIPFVQKVNPDLVGYVTDKSLNGLFYNIGLQEQKIRKDPAAQVTDILKKVFGK